MSRFGNRSFLSWLFLQQPVPKRARKATQKTPVQSPMSTPPHLLKTPQEQSLCSISLHIKSENREDYITVNTFPASIGRVDDGETAVVIEDGSISKHHASILLRDSALYIIDNNSKNGVRLRGQALTAGKPASINQGDILRLGRVEVRVDEIIIEPDHEENQTEVVFNNENQPMYIPDNLHKSPGIAPTVKPTTMPVRPPPEHALKVDRFCTGCGKANTAMKNFCGKCGKNLQIK